MLKIIVKNGVVVIVGSWEEISEEIFGYPECENVETLVEWMKRSGKGIIEVDGEFESAVDRGIAKTRARFDNPRRRYYLPDEELC